MGDGQAEENDADEGAVEKAQALGDSDPWRVFVDVGEGDEA